MSLSCWTHYKPKNIFSGLVAHSFLSTVGIHTSNSTTSCGDATVSFKCSVSVCTCQQFCTTTLPSTHKWLVLMLSANKPFSFGLDVKRTAALGHLGSMFLFFYFFYCDHVHCWIKPELLYRYISIPIFSSPWFFYTTTKATLVEFLDRLSERHWL